MRIIDGNWRPPAAIVRTRNHLDRIQLNNNFCCSNFPSTHREEKKRLTEHERSDDELFVQCGSSLFCRDS